MKTNFISIIIALFITCSLISCKKNYTCSCSYSGGALEGPQTISVEIANAKHNDAYNACEAEEASGNSQQAAIDQIGYCSCELK